jgi:hypothetical protein
MTRKAVAVWLLPIIGLAITVSIAAAGEPQIRAGLLECDVSAGVGLIFSEKQTMDCTFKPVGGGASDHYEGKIEETGIALGATAKGIMIWSVVSAAHGVPNGALAGKYTGLSANASLGLGSARMSLPAGPTAPSCCSRHPMKDRSD